MPSLWEYLLGGQQAPVFPQGQPEPTPLPMRPMAVPPQFAMPPQAIAEPTERFLGSLASAGKGMAAGASADILPLLNMIAGPGRAMQAGYAGQPLTTEEMVPWAANTALQTVGMGSPFAQAGALGSAGGKPGIRAFHGSPHDFERFDIGRIGTGEGAQAYGHGLYFAENEPTAKYYRDALTQHSGAVQVTTPFRDGILDNSPRSSERFFAARFKENKGDLDATIKQLQGDLANHPNDKTIQETIAFAKTPKANFTLNDVNPGKMYEVNIKAAPEQFLDWDKPLSEQQLKMLPNTEPVRVLKDYLQKSGKELTGGDLYRALGEDAAPMLQKAGIPGIRYLDQGSRADMPAIQLQAMRNDLVRFKKQGNTEAANALEAKLNQYDNPTRNYVVFNDALIDILKKYGLIGMLGGTTAAPIFARQDQQ